MKKILACGHASWFILTACSDMESVVFSEPQPKHVKADKEIRSAYRGIYVHEGDSLWLYITGKKAILSNDSAGVNAEYSKSSQGHLKVGNESDFELDFQSVEDSATGERVGIKGRFRLTLLDIDLGGKPKFFKGYYFLNQPAHETEGYNVRMLRPSTEGLFLCRIKSDSLLHLLEGKSFVTKKSDPEGDQTAWSLNPSRKELKKLIDSGLFDEVLDFKRVNPK